MFLTSHLNLNSLYLLLSCPAHSCLHCGTFLYKDRGLHYCEEEEEEAEEVSK